MSKAGGKRFAVFHELNGDKTSVAVGAVVGIEQGSYEREFMEKQKNPYDGPPPDKLPFANPKNRWQRFRNFLAAGPSTDPETRELWRERWESDEWFGDPPIIESKNSNLEIGTPSERKYRKKRRTEPCTLIHLRIGSRTRTIKVVEPYDEVVNALEGA